LTREHVNLTTISVSRTPKSECRCSGTVFKDGSSNADCDDCLMAPFSALRYVLQNAVAALRINPRKRWPLQNPQTPQQIGN
jgi:hypothetical protein